MADLESDLTWGCYIPSLLTELQFHRSWSSETRYSTVPSLRSPSLAVYPQSHTLLRYTTAGENVTNNTGNMTHLILKALHQNHPYICSANHPHPQANEIHTQQDKATGTTHLLWSTASAIYRRVQFGATGAVHWTPKNLANVLKERRNPQTMRLFTKISDIFSWCLDAQYSHQPHGRR